MPRYESEKQTPSERTPSPRGAHRSPRHTPQPVRPVAPLPAEQRLTILAKLFGPQPAWSGGGGLDDPHEREADKTAAELVSPKPGPLSRPVSPARSGAGLKNVHPVIQTAIANAAGGGEALPTGLQRRFGQKLGTDLSSVRVHTDSQADSLSHALNARAFTTGRDVFFRRGQYSPQSSEGQALLAHELTHVAQQSGGSAATQRSVQPTIQRYIMQIGKDDSYTTGMVEKLRKQHAKEAYLQFRAIWDFGGKVYRPKKISKEKGISPDYKLADLAKDEPIRIVGHGDGAGKVGGYTGEAMAHLLVELGLPLAHQGGIDVHACMPGSPYTEDDGKQKKRKQPHIVELQDKLAEVDIHEVVSGYEHCIFPSNMDEVPAKAYYLYTDVAMVAHAARDNQDWALNKEQLATMTEVMGEKECAAFLKAHTTDGKKPKGNGLAFYFALRDWMASKKLFIKAKLRRADSMRDETL